jgi:hypothetical protein
LLTLKAPPLRTSLLGLLNARCDSLAGSASPSFPPGRGVRRCCARPARPATACGCGQQPFKCLCDRIYDGDGQRRRHGVSLRHGAVRSCPPPPYSSSSPNLRPQALAMASGLWPSGERWHVSATLLPIRGLGQGRSPQGRLRSRAAAGRQQAPGTRRRRLGAWPSGATTPAGGEAASGRGKIAKTPGQRLGMGADQTALIHTFGEGSTYKFRSRH